MATASREGSGLNTVTLGWPLAILLILLTGASAALYRLAGLGRPTSVITAAVRAVGQLAVVSLVIGTVLHSLPLTVAFLALMVLVAAGTSAHCITEELTAQRGSYEAALSLGMTRRDGVVLVAREPAALALIPGLDQTRTVGLVTLPGAFVGVLLAGGSPLQAGAVQILVLISLLLVQALAVLVTIELVAAGLLAVGEHPLPD
jgi:putative ABC transport system permease protein